MAIKLNGFIATQEMLDATDELRKWIQENQATLITLQAKFDALGNIKLPFENQNGEKVQHGARVACDGAANMLQGIINQLARVN